jgi:hypothetical protein
MSRPTRCITIALASLAIAAPAASAMVVDPMPTSGSTGPTQDLRNPDQRVPAQSVQDMHASTAIAAREAQPSASQSSSDDGVSPLVYVLPSAALLAALGAATGFAVSSGRFPRSHARV